MKKIVLCTVIILALLGVGGTLGCSSPAKENYERGCDLLDEGKTEEAIAEFSKAIELDPDYAPAYNNRGDAYSEKGQHDVAIADYDKAIELDPNYAEAYNNRGEAYFWEKQYELAIADCSMAIELDPDYSEAYYYRGLAYLGEEQYELAIVDYSMAIELDLEYTSAYFWRAVAYTVEGQYNLAIADCSMAIELDPDYSEAYRYRGLAYFWEEQYELAIVDYSMAIELDPDYSEAYYNRGIAYYEIEQYELAIVDYSMAIELNIELDLEYTSAYFSRGLAYYEIEQYELAIVDYSMFIELEPDDADAWNNKGVALEELGEYEEALECYNKAIELDPSHETAQNNRDRLVALSVRGKVTNKETGSLEGNAVITIDLTNNAGEDVSISTTSSDGAVDSMGNNYTIFLPKYLPDTNLPPTVILNCTKSGFMPLATDVSNPGEWIVDFPLEPIAGECILIDSRLHHLGDDSYEGSVNSQFQMSAEGSTYSKSFTVEPGQLTFAKATLLITHRGAQVNNPIKINGTTITVLNNSFADGSIGIGSITFDKSLLKAGSNTITITSVTGQSPPDIDDFEFTNLIIKFSN